MLISDSKNSPEADGNPASAEYARYGVALFFIFLVLACTQVRNDFTNPDGIGYYAHIRSAALDRDLFYLNEYDSLRISQYFFDPSPTGYVQNQWPVGCALLWSPFFGAAQALGAAGRAAGLETPRGGYSPFDALAVSFATAFYGFLCILICMRLLRLTGISPRAAFPSIILLWLGTPFFYYQFYEAAMAHVCSAFAASLFVYFWQQNRKSSGLSCWALTGAAAGLAALVRTELALLSLLTALDLIAGLKSRDLKTTVCGAVVFAAAALFVFSPQMIVWRALNGSFFSSYQGAANFLWSNPHPFETLFSDYHGLFAWSPVVILAVLGWFLYMRRDAVAGVGIVAVFTAFVYVVSCLIWWWGSGAFGARFFVGIFPLFAVGLAAFIDTCRRRWLSALLAAAASAWTVLLMLQVLTGRIWLVRFYPFRELIANDLDMFSAPLSVIKTFFTPKIIGLDTVAAVVGIAAAASAGFIAIILFWKYATRRRALILTFIAVLSMDALFLTSWNNSGRVRAESEAEMPRVARYPLEELYETFPLDYANYYLKKGRPETALRELAKLEKIVPENPAVPVVEAGVLLMIGDKHRARLKIENADVMKMRHPLTRASFEKIRKSLE